MRIARRILLAVCSGILAGSLFFACPARARMQQGAGSNVPAASITGRVTAVSGEGTANAIPGVNVKLTGPATGATPQTTVTDSEGRFEFSHLASGTYTMEASADGFKTWSGTITLTAGQALVKDVPLQIQHLRFHDTYM